MARSRVVVTVGIVPWLLGRGLRGLFILALVVCALALAFAWPLVAFHTTTVVHPSVCTPGVFGGQDCTPAVTADHTTPLGWFLELCWITALSWSFWAWKRHGKPKAVKPAKVARRVQPKAAPGPRDYHLAPPVKP